MAVTLQLVCSEVANLPTTATADTVAAPASATITNRVSVTFSNKTATDTTISVFRYNGTTNFSIATGKKVAANDSLTITDIYLTSGKSIRMLAGAANAIDVIIDNIVRTET